MDDELKEILNKLEIVARKHTIEVCEDGSKIERMTASVFDELRLNNYSSKLLLNYITNLQQKVEQYENPEDLTLFYMWIDEKAKDKMKELQQENENIKKLKERYQLEKENYKSRIDKAIDYMEKHRHQNKDIITYDSGYDDEMTLSILKGDSNENN